MGAVQADRVTLLDSSLAVLSLDKTIGVAGEQNYYRFEDSAYGVLNSFVNFVV